ncbi:MAG: RDD family protein [Planctomycetaceae bacterium]
MPVKIRCKGCEKVLNVPDRARGKSIRCPNCETVLRVPAGRKTAPAGKKREPQPVRQAVDRDDFLGGMDLRRAADSRVRVCVKCGTEVDEEVVDCPECGHNVDTGVMSDFMRRKRERKGPDPEEFWGVAWSGSFKFLGQNISLAIRTGAYWSIFITLFLYSLFCLAFTTNDPPTYFWMAMAFLFLTGASGWLWTATIKVIQHTMGPKRNKKLESFDFDFFANIALGLRALAWPAVLLLGVVVVAAIGLAIPMAIDRKFVFDETAQLVTTIILSVIYGVAILVYPLAMVHMSMPYTYKASTPYHMGICLGKNILPTLYWFVMAIAVLLPIGLTALILELVVEGGLIGAVRETFVAGADCVLWLMELMGMIKEVKASYPPAFSLEWWAWPVFFALLLPVIAAVTTPICMLYAFPAVFLMRANGYVGLYFRDRLDLVKEQQPNVPCGFWPRYLAMLIDWLVLISCLGAVGGAFYGLAYLCIFFEMDYFAQILNLIFDVLAIVFPWLYFAKPQSNPSSRGSIGKKALGIIVVDEEFETLSFGQASGRYWIKNILASVTFYISWLMAAFTEKKTALHDNIMKTQVVWEGDDERNRI